MLDANGVDLVLVGDSLGMVVQGHDSTLPVTVDDIVYHTACVARGLSRALLVADMPFQSYATPRARARRRGADACRRARRWSSSKAPGHMLDVIRFLAERDIPVCAHLGLTPQSVLRLGGYKVQGREDEAAAQLRADARAVAEAGRRLLVLECVPRALAAADHRVAVAIPTIGIGAGPDCDGQILVLHDMLGIDYRASPAALREGFPAEGRLASPARCRRYADAVRDGSFPDAEHGYDMMRNG